MISVEHSILATSHSISEAMYLKVAGTLKNSHSQQIKLILEFTLRKSNIAGWKMDPLKMVFPVKTWGYSVAMLVYDRVKMMNSIFKRCKINKFRFVEALGLFSLSFSGLDFPSEMVVNGVLRSLHQLDANQVGRTLLTGVINRPSQHVDRFSRKHGRYISHYSERMQLNWEYFFYCFFLKIFVFLREIFI